jgi:hypothetical protein
MVFQNICQFVIYIFRCFNFNKKPLYLEDDSDDEFTEIMQNDNLPYSFIVIK